MRHALRRLLWIGPTLFVISIALFWVLTAGRGDGGLDPDDADEEHPFFGDHSRPRFFNSRPGNVRDLALLAMQSIARNDERAAAAERELVRLGGAALPHVLPQLDSLDPRGRGRVALALAPLAKRMNVGTAEDRASADAALLFWTRFWQDRAIDFRPAVAARAVARLGEKSTVGRRDDVRALDTFALPELMRKLTPVETEADAARVRRISMALASITEQPWRLERDAGLEAARATARTWQRWWLVHHSDYVTHDGAERVFAMLSDTEYGRWAADAVENQLGTSESGKSVRELWSTRAPTTTWLLGAGLVGGFAAGIALGLMGAARANAPFDRSLSALAIVLAALPTTLFALVLAPGGPSAQHAVGAFLMVVTAASVVARHQRSATRVALDQEYARTARAFGAGPWRLALWSFRASCVSVVSLAGTHLAHLLTVAFVVEHALHLEGLGAVTLKAVYAHDIAWLMALSLSVAFLLSLAQIASDLLLGALDPRVHLGLLRKRGAVE
ncbi:MAG: ABC transporter permease [Polyangiaceae bacterium]